MSVGAEDRLIMLYGANEAFVRSVVVRWEGQLPRVLAVVHDGVERLYVRMQGVSYREEFRHVLVGGDVIRQPSIRPDDVRERAEEVVGRMYGHGTTRDEWIEAISDVLAWRTP